MLGLPRVCRAASGVTPGEPGRLAMSSIDSAIRGTRQACAAFLIPTMHSTSAGTASEMWQRPFTIDTGFRPWCHCHLGCGHLCGGQGPTAWALACCGPEAEHPARLRFLCSSVSSILLIPVTCTGHPLLCRGDQGP